MLHNHDRGALSLIYAKAFKYLIAENYAKIVKGKAAAAASPLAGGWRQSFASWLKLPLPKPSEPVSTDGEGEIPIAEVENPLDSTGV